MSETIQTKESPIVMTPENAQKCHEGRKTQTRRIIGERQRVGYPHHEIEQAELDGFRTTGRMPFTWRCPYGTVGDRLWVREAFTYWEDPGYEWTPSRKEPRFEYLSGRRQAEIIERSGTAGHDYLVYKADGAKRSLGDWAYPHPVYDHCIGRFGKTIASIHMPRWACRTVLAITEVRVERVRQISQYDALAEGVSGGPDGDQAVAHFQSLWASIHGLTSWHENPWVWVFSFRRVI